MTDADPRRELGPGPDARDGLFGAGALSCANAAGFRVCTFLFAMVVFQGRSCRPVCAGVRRGCCRAGSAWSWPRIVATRRATGRGELARFEQDIKPLFRRYDRQAMSFAFDLWSYDDVSQHAEAILAQLQAGTMPCVGA
jgi:hypothetical protein